MKVEHYIDPKVEGMISHLEETREFVRKQILETIGIPSNLMSREECIRKQRRCEIELSENAYLKQLSKEIIKLKMIFQQTRILMDEEELINYFSNKTKEGN